MVLDSVKLKVWLRRIQLATSVMGVALALVVLTIAVNLDNAFGLVMGTILLGISGSNVYGHLKKVIKGAGQ